MKTRLSSTLFPLLALAGSGCLDNETPPVFATTFEPQLQGTVLAQEIAPVSATQNTAWLVNLDASLEASQRTNLSQVDVRWYFGGQTILESYTPDDLVKPYEAGTGRRFDNLKGDDWRGTGIDIAEWLDDDTLTTPGHWNGTGATSGTVYGAGVLFEPDAVATLALFDDDGSVDVLRFWQDAHSEIGAFWSDTNRLAFAGGIQNDGRSELGVVHSLHNTIATGPFTDVRLPVPGCEDVEVVSIDVERLNLSGLGRVAAILANATCGGDSVVLVAMVDELGVPAPGFGINGMTLLHGPTGEALRGGGVALRQDAVEGTGVFLTANTGPGCTEPVPQGSMPSDPACRLLATRLDLNGFVDPSFGVGGWLEISHASTTGLASSDLVMVEGAFVTSGWGTVDTGPGEGSWRDQWMLAGFNSTGVMDASFGNPPANLQNLCVAPCGDGVFLLDSPALPGRALALSTDDIPASELWVTGYFGEAVATRDVAVMRFTLDGEYEQMELGEAQWTQNTQGGVEGRAITVTNDGDPIVAGVGATDLPMTAKFMGDGLVLDHAGVIEADESVRLYLPDGHLLTQEPTAIDLQLHDDQYANPKVITMQVETHKTLEGGYTFPLDTSTLPDDRWFRVSQHNTLDTNHRHSRSQRHALDIVMVRAVADGVSGRLPDTDGTENAHSVIYGWNVVSMADGIVLDCHRDEPENPSPGQQSNWERGGGNMYWILHDTGEVALYAHLIPGTLPPSLCPYNGVQALPPTVSRGQVLGQVGNSGSSSGPHLHVHVQKGHADLVPGSLSEGVPMNYVDVEQQLNTADPLTDPWYAVQNQGLAPSVHVR